MYHASLSTLSTIYIDTSQLSLFSSLVSMAHFPTTTIYIQHRHQSVAQKIGETFAPGGSITEEYLVEVSNLYNDAAKAVQEMDEIEEVGAMSVIQSKTGPGNGDATTPVSEIAVRLSWKDRMMGFVKTRDYMLTITVPYDEERYGNLYRLAMWGFSEPVGTGECATCGYPRPEFQCNACEAEMYCGEVCQKEAWEGGHDKACCAHS